VSLIICFIYILHMLHVFYPCVRQSSKYVPSVLSRNLVVRKSDGEGDNRVYGLCGFFFFQIVIIRNLENSKYFSKCNCE